MHLQQSSREVLSVMEPIAWFLSTVPIFMFTIRQSPKSRWSLLPLVVLPPVQSYRTVHQLSEVLPGLDWLLAFTNLIYIIHATSALYLEKWTIPASPPGSSPAWEYLMALRAWMNPRRLPTRNRCDSDIKAATTSQRFLFIAKRLVPLVFLGAVYVGIEIGTLLLLKPGPRDYGVPHQKYFHFHADRAAVFRLCFAFYWAWVTYIILTTVHSILAIIFVGILQVDEPEDWPLLYGNPLAAFSIQRFWGSFWHQIGTSSQLCYGRFIARTLLRLEPNSTLEKVFLPVWVFTVSGIVHALVTRKTEPETDPLSDVRFLALNFCAGLVEFAVRRLRATGARRKEATVLRRLLGYAYVLAFFYCVMPPYHYPALYKAAVRRMPFKVNMKMSR